MADFSMKDMKFLDELSDKQKDAVEEVWSKEKESEESQEERRIKTRILTFVFLASINTIFVSEALWQIPGKLINASIFLAIMYAVILFFKILIITGRIIGNPLSREALELAYPQKLKKYFLNTVNNTLLLLMILLLAANGHILTLLVFALAFVAVALMVVAAHLKVKNELEKLEEK